MPGPNANTNDPTDHDGTEIASSAGADGPSDAAGQYDAVGPMPRADWLIAGGLSLVFVVGIVLTWGGYGHSWDEAYYVDPARLTQEWLGDVVRLRDAPFSRESIDRHWGGDEVIGSEAFINELPALPKFVWAIGLTLFESALGPSRAMRAPVAVAFGLLLLLAYRFCHAIGGRWAGLGASLLLGTAPRVWGEGHLAVAETLAALTSLLTIYCFWRGLSSRAWAVAAGVAFGLALNTKVQAILLPVVLVPWAFVYARPARAAQSAAWLLLAPIVWVATWPWLWPGPVGRLVEFFRFYAGHQATAVWYFGQKWPAGDAMCPWHYPWVITAITTPPLTLLAFLGGAGLAVWQARRRPVLVLLLASALFPLIFTSRPSQMKYDGARLFGAAMPPLAVLAAVALAAWVDLWSAGAKRWASRGAFVLALGGGAAALVLSHPYGLSYFNALIGGPSGADRAGMEVAYWGESINDDVLAYLNELPKNAQLMTRAIHTRTLEQLQEWGKLRKDIRLDQHEGEHYLLMQNRRGFWTRSDFAIHARLRPIRTWESHGAPLLYLYRIGGQ